MNVVVVESPAKAKTINKYLGKDFTVLASYGHVRDLPAKDGSVRPDDNFDMSWIVDSKSEKHIKAIADALKGADKLYLATDPDREGEAISWHVQEVLKERNALKGIDVKRVVFHEITKSAVTDAIANPRDLDHELVDAYMARRALDYLVGFTLSPVLWRKLPGSRSAGRVQSVALRLICEREAEIEIFRPQEYWTVACKFATADGKGFTAGLTHLDGKKLGKFDLGNREAADAAVRAVAAHDYKVSSIERKTVARRPYPPFTTSTLQQEASRKLGFGAQRTMRTAQKLYEGIDVGGETVGLITYMRTDSVTLAGEAINAIRRLIVSDYGENYRPEQPNYYKSKAKNAQEAHEAIRPTDVFRRPRDVSRHLTEDERKLYDLIWKRTVASGMQAAQLEQVAIDVASPDKSVVLRATGSVITFDGFLKIYQEGQDDTPDNGEAGDAILPAVKENDALDRGEISPDQHFTKPPPRYSEASLVKKLEELGIGRPSTYASIISVLQERSYVVLESRRFVPVERGRIVTAFLTEFFRRYVEYDFTAELEDRLDGVSNGDIDWRQLLRDFWTAFSAAVEATSGLTITAVIDKLDEELGPHFFPLDEKNPGKDPRKCPACEAGRLGLKLGKTGGFIGCSNYPECRYTRTLSVVTGDEDEGAALSGPRELGLDPATGKMITLRKGPYGFYVQLGEPEGKEKPKRGSLLRGMSASDVDLGLALKLLSLPREVGVHPELGEMILAGVGRFGPYLKYGSKYVSLKGDDDILTIGLNRAVAVIAEAPKKKTVEALREMGNHPEDGKPVQVLSGRYGPYLKHGRTNATVPKDEAVETLTMERATELLAARATKSGTKKKAPAKKAPAKKAPGKKAPAKKAPAKKTGAKKAASKKGGSSKAPGMQEKADADA